MFYHLLYPLTHKIFTGFNIFRYITFRAFCAFLLSTGLAIWLGKYFIEWMRNKQFGQIVREDGPSTHLKKAGTPTAGGVFVWLSIVISLIICGNFKSLIFDLTILLSLAMGYLGFQDDYLKIKKKNTKGVSAKGKLFWQILVSSVVVGILVYTKSINTKLYFPFFKGMEIDLGMLYIPFGALVIISSSNAVNLTDGLDGLAIGPIITSACTLGVLSYLSGHLDYSNYLLIPHVANSGEILVFASALVGASLGLLWYNSYPAQIFMGDVGSLSLGAALGLMAVVSKNEILFILIGALFVLETLSVIIQVISFKTRKKRVFKMAPLHHHFELSGWSEPKVIVRFWIFSVFSAILAIATIKVR